MSVLSYNVFLRSDPITAEDTAAENDFKEERMQALIALLDAYDVLLLQEVWTPLSDGRKGRLIRAAEAKGFRFWVRSACCGRPVDAMLLIMSRHPITDSGEFVFPGGVSNDMMASKGVLWARVKPSSASGRAIDMFTTHLQSGSDPEEKMTERRRQVSQLGDFVREKIETQAAGEEGGALIAGDFNVHGRTSMMNGTISEPYGAMITNLAMNTESGLQLTDLILHDQPASQRGELQITEPIWPKRLLEYNTSRDGGKALDYMFLVTQLGAREGSAGLGYFSPINGTCVVDPMAARSGEPFVTISDHFATNCRITY
jgi:endonuclease/exonuclease/phosphatase family metal-dependent hydrolase